MAYGSYPQGNNTIQEVSQLIAQRRQELEQARGTISGFQPQIQQSAQQLFRQTATGQARVQGAEMQMRQQKSAAEQQLQQTEQYLADYERQVQDLQNQAARPAADYQAGLQLGEKLSLQNKGNIYSQEIQNPNISGQFKEGLKAGYYRTGSVQEYAKDIAEYRKVEPYLVSQGIELSEAAAKRIESIQKGLSPKFAQEFKTVEQQEPLGFSYDLSKAYPKLEIPRNVPLGMSIREPTFLDRYRTATQGREFIPGLRSTAIPATIEFLGKEAARVAGKIPFEQIPTAFMGRKVEGYYNEYGDYIKYDKPIPIEQYPGLVPKIQARREEFSKLTEKESTPFFQSLPYFVPGVSEPLMFLSGAEKYTTPGGRMILAEQAKAYPSLKPLIYTAPAAELGLGALGIRQQFLSSQVEALKAARPEVSVGIPFSKGKEQYLFQIAEQRIPSPGFVYKPIPFGKEGISPRIVTPMIAKLTSTPQGGFTFSGEAQTRMGILDPLTGLAKFTGTPKYTFFGKIGPGEGGSLVGRGLRIGPIDQTFYGKTTLEVGRPGKQEFFGGFPVGETKQGIQKVVSFPIEKLRYYPGEDIVRAVGKAPPKTYGIILPEVKNPFSLFPAGKKAQIAFTGLETSPRVITDFVPAKKLSTVFEKGIAQSVGRLGTGLLDVPKYTPLFKFITPPIERTAVTSIVIPREVLVPKEVLTPKYVTLSKSIQIPTPVTIEKTIATVIQFPKLAQVPKITEIPKITQVPKMVTSPKYTPTYTPTTFRPPKIIFKTPTLFPDEFGRKRIRKKITPLAFQVSVRRRGKFQTIGIPLAKGEALSLGRKITKGTAAATFKLTPTKAKAGTIGLPIINESALVPEFRSPKRGGDNLTFIQRSRFRISSYGEKREIPYAAAKARRIKWI